MAIPDKTMTEAEVIGELRSGMTIGIGGWGSRRKPMSLIRELLRSDLTDLTVVSYGGPDVGLLCRAGKVRKVITGFVTLDSIALEPHYCNARTTQSAQFVEWDEGMLMLGMQAAAWRLPFLPTRSGLGSDIVTHQRDLKMVTSPYEDAETLLAVPALQLDAALIHMHRADRGGNGQFLNSDLYMDDWMAMAATNCYMSCEQLIATEEFPAHGSFHTQRISRLMTSGVVERRGAAHFTECPPDYGRDEAFQREYAATAKSDEAWEAFKAKYLDVSEDDYQRLVGIAS